MIYIISFLISTIFVYFGDKFKHNRKYLSQIAFFLGVLIVAVLAGARDLTIGTDIQTYGEWMFKSALKNGDMFSYVKSYSYIDLLFTVLVFCVARFFMDSHWLYFVIGLLQYGFTLGAIRKYGDKISVSFSWLCYLLVFYGDSLNAMRQCIAMAIAFWAFGFLIDKKYVKYFIWTIISVLFHNTALIAFFIAMVYWLIQKKNREYIRVGILIVTILVTRFYAVIFQFMINIGILNQRFEKYVGTNYGFEINPFLIRIPFIIMIYMVYREFSEYKSTKYSKLGKNNADFIISLLIIEVITAEMRAFLPVFYRISFYFGYAKIVAYSRLAMVHRRRERNIYSIVIIAFLFILWIYQNVYKGNNDIYPYSSLILGIG